MQALGVGLIVVGAIIFLVGSLQFLIAAFKASIWWALGVLLLPLLQLVFLVVQFREAWPPTKRCLLGCAICFLGAVLHGGVQQTHMGAMVMEDLTPCFSGHQMVAIE